MVHPDRVLAKTSTDNHSWPDGEIDAQMIEVPGAYTVLR